MTRECHVRFCERLGVRLPGATLPPRTPKIGASRGWKRALVAPVENAFECLPCVTTLILLDPTEVGPVAIL